MGKLKISSGFMPGACFNYPVYPNIFAVNIILNGESIMINSAENTEIKLKLEGNNYYNVCKEIMFACDLLRDNITINKKEVQEG